MSPPRNLTWLRVALDTRGIAQVERPSAVVLNYGGMPSGGGCAKHVPQERPTLPSPGGRHMNGPKKRPAVARAKSVQHAISNIQKELFWRNKHQDSVINPAQNKSTKRKCQQRPKYINRV